VFNGCIAYRDKKVVGVFGVFVRRFISDIMIWYDLPSLITYEHVGGTGPALLHRRQ
jgi:hypothetical protein